MSDFEACALAATLRACAPEGDEHKAVATAARLAADMLERQAAQLAALRAGADTEDLHAAPASMMALAAEATRIGIDGAEALHAEAVRRAGVSRLMKAQAAAVAELDAAQAASWLEHEAARVDAADRIAQLEAEAETMRAAVAACDRFFRITMPKMNVKNSFLDAEAISAWNKAEIAISRALADKPAAGGEA